MASGMARNQRAILGRAFPIDSTTPPSHLRSSHPQLGAAVSQPAPGMPIGRQSSGFIPLLPQHTRPAFRTRGGQQPTEGPSKHDGSIAVDWHAILGHASLTIESDHIAATCGGKEALRPCSLVSNTLFKHRSSQLRPRASGATTTTTIIIIIETRHTTAAQWPTCSTAPASAREWHFAVSPGSRAK